MTTRTRIEGSRSSTSTALWAEYEYESLRFCHLTNRIVGNDGEFGKDAAAICMSPYNTVQYMCYDQRDSRKRSPQCCARQLSVD
ncbi:MAG: hypothetical protein ABL921_07875 [Pirellula sp.]